MLPFEGTTQSESGKRGEVYMDNYIWQANVSEILFLLLTTKAYFEVVHKISE